RRGGLGFTLKAGECLRLTGKLLGQKLEGDETVQPSVLRLVHHPHATAAELFNVAVMGKGLADHCGRGLRPRRGKANGRRETSLVCERHWAKVYGLRIEVW